MKLFEITKSQDYLHKLFNDTFGSDDSSMINQGFEHERYDQYPQYIRVIAKQLSCPPKDLKSVSIIRDLDPNDPYVKDTSIKFEKFDRFIRKAIPEFPEPFWTGIHGSPACYDLEIEGYDFIYCIDYGIWKSYFIRDDLLI